MKIPSNLNHHRYVSNEFEAVRLDRWADRMGIALKSCADCFRSAKIIGMISLARKAAIDLRIGDIQQKWCDQTLFNDGAKFVLQQRTARESRLNLEYGARAKF